MREGGGKGVRMGGVACTQTHGGFLGVDTGVVDVLQVFGFNGVPVMVLLI